MIEYHECKEQDEWTAVYKKYDEWVLRSDGGNIPINHCPYCGMKLIEENIINQIHNKLFSPIIKRN